MGVLRLSNQKTYIKQDRKLCLGCFFRQMINQIQRYPIKKRALSLQSKSKKLGNANFKMSATPRGCQRCFVIERDEGINVYFPSDFSPCPLLCQTTLEYISLCCQLFSPCLPSLGVLSFRVICLSFTVISVLVVFLKVSILDIHWIGKMIELIYPVG